MALINNIASAYKCPKCGNSGHNAFIVQNRVTLKQSQPHAKPDQIEATGMTQVFACAKCGEIVKIL